MLQNSNEVIFEIPKNSTIVLANNSFVLYNENVNVEFFEYDENSETQYGFILNMKEFVKVNLTKTLELYFK